MTDSRGSQRPGHHVALDASDTVPEVEEARHLIRSRHLDEAIALLEPLSKGETDDYQIFEVLGVAYAQKGDMQSAVGALQKACHLNPAQPHVHFNLGQALLRTGDMAAAKEALERSLRIDPTYSRAREALQLLLARQTPA